MPAPQKRGTLDGVACPWCDKPNDFHEEMSLGLLETGNKFKCDHCKRTFEIARIAPTTLIWIRRC